MKGVVYILKSEKGRYYVGSTDTMERRMYQHSLGHTQTTRNFKKYTLVLTQTYNSLTEARSVERKIKRMKRKDYIEKMVTDGYIAIKP